MHYINENARVTLDSGVSAFGFFNGDKYVAIKIDGDKENGKLEIKTDLGILVLEKGVKSWIMNRILTPTPKGQSERTIREAYNKTLGGF